MMLKRLLKLSFKLEALWAGIIGTQRLEAMPFSANGAITEMALCEVPHIGLRPGQLYRFIVMPGCKACEDAAAPYSPKTPAQEGERLS